MPLVLSAFVAGDLLLQQAAVLPSRDLLWGLALAAALLAGLAGALWRQRHPLARNSAVALAVVAALLAGFVLTGARATARLAETLAFDDEGRDVRVVAVVASLPTVFEGGTRFSARIESVLPAYGAVAAFAVPPIVALSWYGAGPPSLPPLRPAQRWALTLRLHRPQGTVNPAGFDAEAWMFDQGIRAQGTVRSGPHDAPPQLLAEAVWQFDARVDRARAALRERLQQLLQGRRHAAVIVALVMGDQSGIVDCGKKVFPGRSRYLYDL